MGSGHPPPEGICTAINLQRKATKNYIGSPSPLEYMKFHEVSRKRHTSIDREEGSLSHLHEMVGFLIYWNT
jgi:hypothetical protein